MLSIEYWSVTVGGIELDCLSFDTEAEAEQFVAEFAKNNASAVVAIEHHIELF